MVRRTEEPLARIVPRHNSRLATTPLHSGYRSLRLRLGGVRTHVRQGHFLELEHGQQ